jgi:hypothetical protein
MYFLANCGVITHLVHFTLHQPTFTYPLKLKTVLVGRFQDVGDVKQHITAELNVVCLGTFKDSFVRISEECGRCVVIESIC